METIYRIRSKRSGRYFQVRDVIRDVSGEVRGVLGEWMDAEAMGTEFPSMTEATLAAEKIGLINYEVVPGSPKP